MKKKLIITSVMTIVVCLSLITGATLAYFTDSANVNIAVNSAKVDINATINDETFEKWSLTEDRTDKATFTNGGTATLGADSLDLALVSPGDGVKFEIDIANGSNIAIKYNVRMVIEFDDAGLTADEIAACEALTAALDVRATINGTEYKISNAEKETGFVLVPQNQSIDSITVVVELPKETGNEAQDASVTIKFVVEAVQGNGEY